MISDVSVQQSPTKAVSPLLKSGDDKGSGLILTVVATRTSWSIPRICRLAFVFCMLILPLSMNLAYAQESASVPVTIILEGPENTTSISETAPLELVINPLEIDVQLGGFNSFRVRLNSRPTGQVSVSIEVTTAPSSSGDVRDITITTDRDDGYLLFLPEERNREKIVRVDAETDAELGDYIVKLDASGNEGTDTGNVTVTVKDWMKRFNVPQIWNVRQRYRHYLEFALTVVEGDFVIPVTLTLSIPNKPDYLSFSPSMLTFDEDNYGTSQRFTIEATSAAVVGAEHLFTVTLSREEYNDISRSGNIKILPNFCTPALSVREEDLDFGTWIRPEAGAPEGRVTINVRTGISSGTMVAAEGNSPTASSMVLTTEDCVYCLVDHIKSDLIGKISGDPIDFFMTWGAWNTEEDGSLGVFLGGNETDALGVVNPDVSPTAIRFGGTISGIDSDTSIDTYEGSIVVQAVCR